MTRRSNKPETADTASKQVRTAGTAQYGEVHRNDPKLGGFYESARPKDAARDGSLVIRTREADPDDWSGLGYALPKLKFERYVAEDGHTPEAREALRHLRTRGVDVGLLLGDVLPSLPGSTKRGIPPDYAGDDPRLCNARTKSGRPCRGLKLAHGRCKWHGGLSTGPRTPEGKARCTMNLPWAKA